MLCFIISTDALCQNRFQIIEVIDQKKIQSQQGAALCNDYLFHFTAKSECLIYNIKKGTFISKTKGVFDETGHCDTACFGKKKYKWYDRFPLIYVSGSNTTMDDHKGKIWVYRVLQKNGQWTLVLVQIIDTPPVRDVWAFPDVVFDKEGKMWIMGWNQKCSYKNEKHRAKVIFNRFDCPSPNAGILKDGIRYYSMNYKDVIDSFIVDNMHRVQQGICFHENIIYVPYGSTASGYQGIDVVDIKKKKVIVNYNLFGTKVKEPESVFVYKNNLYIADQGTSIKLLKLTNE